MTIDWQAYVNEVAALLCLKDWTVELTDDHPNDTEGLAEIEPVDGRKYAVLRLCAHWHDRTPEKQRHSIVHELVHLHHVAATDIIRVDMPRHLSQQAYDILWGAFLRQVEYLVDGLADALAPFMPLPGGK